MSDALHEINEILGYEYFKQDMIKQISENFLLVVPVAEEIVKELRGVNLDEIEKEQYDANRLMLMRQIIKEDVTNHNETLTQLEQ
jgi:hypothetical protein